MDWGQLQGSPKASKERGRRKGAMVPRGGLCGRLQAGPAVDDRQTLSGGEKAQAKLAPDKRKRAWPPGAMDAWRRAALGAQSEKSA